jgi:hypothetical protein
VLGADSPWRRQQQLHAAQHNHARPGPTKRAAKLALTTHPYRLRFLAGGTVPSLMSQFFGDLVSNVPTTLHNLSTTLSSPFNKTKLNSKRTNLPPTYQPDDWDVCCGRGKMNWNHKGNIRFRNLVQSNVQRYMDSSTRNDKTQIVNGIVDFVREKGGNFLKQDKSDHWYDIGDSEARDKGMI